MNNSETPPDLTPDDCIFAIEDAGQDFVRLVGERHGPRQIREAARDGEQVHHLLVAADPNAGLAYGVLVACLDRGSRRIFVVARIFAEAVKSAALPEPFRTLSQSHHSGLICIPKEGE